MELRALNKWGTLTAKEASYVSFMLHKGNRDYTVLSSMEHNGKPVCLEIYNGYDLTMIKGMEFEIENNMNLKEVVVHTNLPVNSLQKLPMYNRIKELSDQHKVKLIMEFDDFMLDELQANKLGWDNVCIRRAKRV